MKAKSDPITIECPIKAEEEHHHHHHHHHHGSSSSHHHSSHHHHHHRRPRFKVVFASPDQGNANPQKIRERLDSLQAQGCKDIHTGPLCKGLLLDNQMFDMRGNTFGKYWGDPSKTYYSGPQRKKIIYLPAFNFIGYGLSVKGKYPGNQEWMGHYSKPGEWWNGYQGIRFPGEDIKGATNLKVAGAIIKNGFLTGKNHEFYQNGIHRSNSGWVDLRGKEEKDLNHPGQRCKWGAYFTPYPDYAQNFTQYHGLSFNGKEYCIIFMVKLNPDTTMIRDLVHSEWLCDGSANQVRPFRILVLDKSSPNFKIVSKEDVKNMRNKRIAIKTD